MKNRSSVRSHGEDAYQPVSSCCQFKSQAIAIKCALASAVKRLISTVPKRRLVLRRLGKFAVKQAVSRFEDKYLARTDDLDIFE